MSRFALSVLVLLLAAPGAPAADVSVSFPLGEHYRIGRYLPVHLVASGSGAAKLRIDCPGAVPGEIAGPTVDAIVPLLAVTALGRPTWTSGGTTQPIGQTLRALQDNERLIGATHSDGTLASELFPETRIVTVRLDGSKPLRSSPGAWSSLDAILLDAASAARVTQEQLGKLLAGGTTVAVRSERRPEGHWGWQQLGDWWVIRPELAGPRSSIQADAYLPVLGWSPGMSTARSRLLVLMLAAFSIVAIGVTLWRSRYAMLIVVAVSAIATAGLIAWRGANRAEVRSATAVVVVQRSIAEQQDDWTYFAVHAPGEVRHAAIREGVGKPVFASRRHFEAVGVSLHCDSTGTPLKFVFALERGQTLAMLDRSMHPRHQTPVKNLEPLSRLRMRGMVERLYLSPEDRMAGTAAAAAESDSFAERIVVERSTGTATMPVQPAAASRAARPR